MPEVVRHAIESGSRENLIAVLNELTTRKQENGLVPDEIRAVRPFGAGLLTQYAEWLLTAQSDPTSWLRTSPIKSQMRSKQSRRLEVDVSAMVPPIPDSMCQRPRYFCSSSGGGVSHPLAGHVPVFVGASALSSAPILAVQYKNEDIQQVVVSKSTEMLKC